ncbi:hypothetical protein [Streptomyces sp.]|uniref:hypothetical protein n=1 Tax=Streptomyces sp. TaxID=1931 RepID=UPI0028119965|nr:hypothetical protein [Streptomyces sp.]
MKVQDERQRRWAGALCSVVVLTGVLTTVLGWPGPGDLEAYGELGWTNPVAGAIIAALGVMLLVGNARDRLRPNGDRVVLVLFLVPPAVLGLLALGGRLPPALNPVLGLLLLWSAAFTVLLFTPQRPAGRTARN